MMDAFLNAVEKYGEPMGALITGIGVIAAGVWGLKLYRESKKKEAAQWLHQLFSNFYLNAGFQRLRDCFEFDYSKKLKPIIERLLKDESCDMSADERKLWCDLDTLLNYFEFILHLENQGQFERADREALFNYWFCQLKRADHDTLRKYIEQYDYQAIAKALEESSKK